MLVRARTVWRQRRPSSPLTNGIGTTAPCVAERGAVALQAHHGEWRLKSWHPRKVPPRVPGRREAHRSGSDACWTSASHRLVEFQAACLTTWSLHERDTRCGYNEHRVQRPVHRPVMRVEPLLLPTLGMLVAYGTAQRRSTSSLECDGAHVTRPSIGQLIGVPVALLLSASDAIAECWSPPWQAPITAAVSLAHRVIGCGVIQYEMTFWSDVGDSCPLTVRLYYGEGHDPNLGSYVVYLPDGIATNEVLHAEHVVDFRSLPEFSRASSRGEVYGLMSEAYIDNLTYVMIAPVGLPHATDFVALEPCSVDAERSDGGEDGTLVDIGTHDEDCCVALDSGSDQDAERVGLIEDAAGESTLVPSDGGCAVIGGLSRSSSLSAFFMLFCLARLWVGALVQHSSRRSSCDGPADAREKMRPGASRRGRASTGRGSLRRR